MYTRTYLTLLTFKVEPTEVQDPMKNQISDFSSYLLNSIYFKKNYQELARPTLIFSLQMQCGFFQMQK